MYLWDGLLRWLRDGTVARSMARASVVGSAGAGAGIVEAVGDLLLHRLREDFLELLGDNGAADSVGSVSSLRHDGRVVW